jgi:hypothetical protein
VRELQTTRLLDILSDKTELKKEKIELVFGHDNIKEIEVTQAVSCLKG